MDGIKARIRDRFSRRKSGGFGSLTRADTARKGSGKPGDGRASLGGSEPAGEGASSQSGSVGSPCNSQQVTHHRQNAESAASVTTASTGDGDARTITTASTIERPHQNLAHDGRIEDFCIDESRHGINTHK